jgi:hypothetical protein
MSTVKKKNRYQIVSRDIINYIIMEYSDSINFTLN